MKPQRIAVIGAGGFAREVRWLIREISAAGRAYDFVGYLVSDLDKLGPTDSSDDVIGDLGWLRRHGDDIEALALGIGTPSVRRSIGTTLAGEHPAIQWPSLVHPSVIFEEGCEFGKGALLCAGVIATVNVTIDDFAMVNLSCTLGHEARIGKGTVLNPDVNISGGVVLGNDVLVGTGAQILQYVTVGDGATVGAGAVVTKDVADSTTVVGLPAKPLGQTPAKS